MDFRDPNRVRCAFTAGGSKQRPMHQNCTDIVHVCTYVPIHAQHNELYVRMPHWPTKQDRQTRVSNIYALIYNVASAERVCICVCVHHASRPCCSTCVRVCMYVCMCAYACTYVRPQRPYKDTRQCVPVRFDHACPLIQLTFAHTLGSQNSRHHCLATRRYLLADALPADATNICT